MKWYKDLYVGEIASKKKYKLLTRIYGKKLTNAYVIALPSCQDNLLDIYSYNELLQKYYQHEEKYIIGLAYGKEEAVSLVKDIVMEVYKTKGNFLIADYIKEREGSK